MKLGRCPICHSQIHLEQIVQDEAGRALLGLLAGLDGDLGRALVTYLGLFRAKTRDLSNDRALRLAREVLALEADAGHLARALAHTAEAIRAKGGAPLKNHNYLKQVLAGLPRGSGDLPPHPSAVERLPPRPLTAAEIAVSAIRSVDFGDDKGVS